MEKILDFSRGNVPKVIVGLGANLGDRLNTLNQAVLAIERNIGPIIKRSDWFETEPVINEHGLLLSHPPFLNGIAILASDLEPERLLRELNGIEAHLGRVRKEEQIRWAPRLIDLDIIGIGDLVYSSPTLQIPHPEMHKRKFVLEPLVSVWPDWIHPIFLRPCTALNQDLASTLNR